MWNRRNIFFTFFLNTTRKRIVCWLSFVRTNLMNWQPSCFYSNEWLLRCWCNFSRVKVVSEFLIVFMKWKKKPFKMFAILNWIFFCVESIIYFHDGRAHDFTMCLWGKLSPVWHFVRLKVWTAYATFTYVQYIWHFTRFSFYNLNLV